MTSPAKLTLDHARNRLVQAIASVDEFLDPAVPRASLGDGIVGRMAELRDAAKMVNDWIDLAAAADVDMIRDDGKAT